MENGVDRGPIVLLVNLQQLAIVSLPVLARLIVKVELFYYELLKLS